MGKIMYKDKAYAQAPVDVNYFTSPKSVFAGDTSVTIKDRNIHTDSMVKPWADPYSDGSVINIAQVTVTEGQAVVSFNGSATAATTISLEILMPSSPYSETVLWTNPSPSESTGFSQGEVTLSDSISNYDYIKATYGYAYNQYTTDNNINSVIISTSDFINKCTGATGGFGGSLAVWHRSNGNAYFRSFAYHGDTTAYFGSALQVKLEVATAINNIFCIPLTIVGIKDAVESVIVHDYEYTETVLWENEAPSTDFAQTTLTFDQDITNFDFLKIIWSGSTTEGVLQENVYKPTEFVQLTNANSCRVPALGNWRATISSKTGVLLRQMYRPDANLNKILIQACMWVQGNTMTTTGYNNWVIPIKVIGMKHMVKVDDGGLRETVLWSNPDPTAAYSAAQVSVTDRLYNYSYIKFTYKLSTTSAIEGATILSYEDFLKMKYNIDDDRETLCLTAIVGDSYYYRNVAYRSSLAVRWGGAYVLNSGTQDASKIIPLQVIGMR